MALDYDVPEDKRALYWLGDQLIEWRNPVMVLVLIVTGLFAYWTFQLRLVTSFGDLVPQSHEFVKIHNKYSGTFGGANNIVVMYSVEDGTIFTKEHLTAIFKMTEGMDTVYGVNHNQIESIGHRTVRHLKVAAGGTLRAEPVMLRAPQGQDEVDETRRIVHNAENVYGLIVSLDDKSALIRANFIEGRLDYQRIFDDVNSKVIDPFKKDGVEIYAAGEPRLYGWVYKYSGDVFFILVVTYCIEWVLRWMYFHDWRGSLRPTLTGIIAAFWGLGFIHLIGLALDPLMLVMPFLITARAVSHAIQMHDRYYEEFEKCGWHKRRAIVAAFAELFVPTFSGITTDAFGVLVIILVPVVMLQKLAITASWWILAITVSEMLLNPIVYYYLKPPEPELVVLRERGAFRRWIERFTHVLLSPAGKTTTLVFWAALTLVGVFFMRGLTIGDPTSASPLLFENSPYNVSHTKIQESFGGVEPLIVVSEGYDKDAMKDPQVLRTMEKFQRQLERDPDIGYSFSLADIIRAVNRVFHELEPKWAVIPDSWTDIGGLFFIFFSGSPPTETAKYVDPSYTTAHVTFFAKNHQGDNIRRIIQRCKNFIAENPMEKASFKLAGGLIGVLAAANEELVRNDILMNFLGFFTIWIILLFTYRSFVCGLYILGPLIASNILVNAYMAVNNIGVNIHTLPLVTVGVGFGVDYGLYIISRIIEEIQVKGDLDHAVREALVTSGKAVTFTAVTMIVSTAFWITSNIRFNAEMGLLLAIWMSVSYVGSQTLLPVLVAVFKPKFITREANTKAPKPALAAAARQA
ncbi:MAG: MMPL family transporter [Deltaproteobacteria bacterium]|nr:MMPL family transporter [Deltaproteobacteria bacterium]